MAKQEQLVTHAGLIARINSHNAKAKTTKIYSENVRTLLTEFLQHLKADPDIAKRSGEHKLKGNAHPTCGWYNKRKKELGLEGADCPEHSKALDRCLVHEFTLQNNEIRWNEKKFPVAEEMFDIFIKIALTEMNITVVPGGTIKKDEFKKVEAKFVEQYCITNTVIELLIDKKGNNNNNDPVGPAAAAAAPASSTATQPMMDATHPHQATAPADSTTATGGEGGHWQTLPYATQQQGTYYMHGNGAPNNNHPTLLQQTHANLYPFFGGHGWPSFQYGPVPQLQGNFGMHGAPHQQELLKAGNQNDQTHSHQTSAPTTAAATSTAAAASTTSNDTAGNEATAASVAGVRLPTSCTQNDTSAINRADNTTNHNLHGPPAEELQQQKVEDKEFQAKVLGAIHVLGEQLNRVEKVAEKSAVAADETKTQIGELQTVVDAVNRDNEGLKQEMKRLNEKLEEKENEVDNLKKELAASLKVNAQLGAENNELKKKTLSGLKKTLAPNMHNAVPSPTTK